MGRFGWTLTAIGVVALVVRLSFALTVGVESSSGGIDAVRYHDLAGNLADGNGYTAHVAKGDGTDATVLVPDAQHPPLHPVLLAVADVVGFHSWNAHRVMASVVAALGVVVTGLLGRRLIAPSVGLVAASLAAIHPLWFQHSGYIVSEATLLFVIPVTLLAATFALERAQAWRFVVLGATIGLSALTRTEALMLLPILGVPVALLALDRRRLRAMAMIGLGVLVVVGPWVARNERTFGTPAISLNGGGTLAGSNCDGTYYGRNIGAFDVGCAYRAGGVVLLSRGGVWPGQGAMDRETRKIAQDYARANLSRLPLVALARAGRTAGVYQIGDSIGFDRYMGADRRFQWAGYLLHWTLIPLAVVGTVVLARRGSRRALVVLAAGPALALATGVLVYGATRMRVAAEPALVILAAVALVALWERLFAGRTTTVPTTRHEGAAKI